VRRIKIDIEEIKNRILSILKKYDAKRARVFGSVVKGGAREDSDVDILVEIESDISLFDFVGLKN